VNTLDDTGIVDAEGRNMHHPRWVKLLWLREIPLSAQSCLHISVYEPAAPGCVGEVGSHKPPARPRETYFTISRHQHHAHVAYSVRGAFEILKRQ
jgi:hypothetical protein